ncbi:MAG: aminotransferase class V-fold PLP-dependent enzyme [Pseudanabaena sp. RU_4_16]|nr:aminotransferase class V-fold PLP-dependent enzyme [Pseudanabaena sp. RU_4_16]
MDILTHRSYYPALKNRTYFNYGGQGPMCQTALERIAQNYQHIESLGSFSAAANAWGVEEAERLREAIATEFNVKVQTITLTEDTTVGCNIALWSINWQQGDRLLLSDCEHPGIIAIATQLQSRFGIEFSYFPLQQTLNGSDRDVIEAISTHLHPRTRMVMLSHICWNTGQVLPLKQIAQACHQHGILVAVDAAQSAGAVPLDLADLEADFYAFTGHKWWCGPLGVGGLYIRPEIFDRALPTFIGWRGITACKPNVEWQQNGQKFEVASSAYPLYGALREAIAHANQWGNQRERYERMCKLSGILWQKLAAIPQLACLRANPPQAGLVAFTIVGKSPVAVMHKLECEHQILIRSIPDPDCLRASVHYLTVEDEIDRLVSVLAHEVY